MSVKSGEKDNWGKGSGSGSSPCPSNVGVDNSVPEFKSFKFVSREDEFVKSVVNIEDDTERGGEVG